MSEPPQGPTVFRLIAAAVFVALVIGGLWLQGRRAEPQSPAPDTVAAASPPPAVELPPPPLDREALLAAVADAADAYASGRAADAALVGRNFELAIVFGCDGPALAGSAAPQRWEYDPETQALKVSVRPVDFSGLAWLPRVIGDRPVEAAEGFWIDRPWQRAPACPRYRTPLDRDASLTIPRETLAIVQLFASGTPRSRQRDDRAYEIVRKTPPEQVAELGGFRLVIEGRLAALANGGAIGCWAPSPDLRPTCLVSADFERVRLEQLGAPTTLAEWRP